MKEKALVYISKEYVYKKKYEEVLLKFIPLYSYVLCRFNVTIPKELTKAGISFELIDKAFLYNFLRDEASLIIIFYDLEDNHAQDLIKYCTKHSKPFLIINNPLDDWDL